MENSFQESLLCNTPLIFVQSMENFSIDLLLALLESIPNSNFNIVDCSQSNSYGLSATISTTIQNFLKLIENKANAYYLKDFHYENYCELQTIFAAVTPKQCRNDWLNWYWKVYLGSCDDYSFLYFGGSGTSTGIHHDVCCSYSWSTNILGRKKWTLWHPRTSHQLMKRYTNSPSYFKLAPCDEVSDVHSTIDSSPIVLIQEEGQTIFVPSGWYHMVENLGRDSDTQDAVSHVDWTVSVNKNWLNEYCVCDCWLFVCREWKAVRQELMHLCDNAAVAGTGAAAAAGHDQCHLGERLSTCDRPAALMSPSEWHLQCELLLKANASINVSEWLALVSARLCVMLQLHVCRADPLLLAVTDDDKDDTFLAFQSHWIPAPVPEWAATLCPLMCGDDNVRRCVTRAEVLVSREQLQQTVLHPQPQVNLLSSYTADYENHILLQTEKCCERCGAEESPVSGPSGYALSYPMSGWSHACGEVLRVLRDMLATEGLVGHLSDVWSARDGVMVDAVLLLTHACDSCSTCP